MWPPSSRSTGWFFAAAALALAVFLVFKGALDLYFAQEDFRALAVAKGILPRHEALWRCVSVQLFMDVFHPLFGDRPWPYHFTSLALHCGNSIFLFGLLGRRMAPTAALLGACFYATHPALFTALYWLSARADILATTFALSTVALASRPGRERWMAVPAYALSVLSKESMLLLPAVVVVLRRWARTAARGRSDDESSLDPRQSPRRDWLVPALFLMSACYLVYLLGGKQTGVGISLDPKAAYALDFRTASIGNLLTYVGWTVDLARMPARLRFLDIRNPGLFPLAIATLVVWGLGTLSPRLRARGWLVGGVSFLILLLPVLPLRNHTYQYYLYGPLVAVALCLGALVEEALGRVSRSEQPPRGSGKPAAARNTSAQRAARERAAWATIVACCVALALNGSRLVTKRWRRGRSGCTPSFAAIRL